MRYTSNSYVQANRILKYFHVLAYRPLPCPFTSVMSTVAVEAKTRVLSSAVVHECACRAFRRCLNSD